MTAVEYNLARLDAKKEILSALLHKTYTTKENKV